MSNLENFVPSDTHQLQQAIEWALHHETPLAINGSGSRTAIGNPCSAEHNLHMHNFDSVMLYEPEELILQANAATPMGDIAKLLDQSAQCLAFDPPDYRTMLAGSGRVDNKQGTIGGMISCALAGSRRIKYGGVRDYVLGFSAVSGRAETFKAGGRVVKNVTGYDLSKLFTGHWGTLGVVSDYYLKTGPKPTHSQTIIIRDCTAAMAQDLMTLAMRTQHDVCAAAWMPNALVCKLPDTPGDIVEGICVLRIEGAQISVTHRASALIDFLHKHQANIALDPLEGDRALWQAINDCLAFADTDTRVWRISAEATKGAQLLQQCIDQLAQAGLPNAQGYLDWAGGLIWLNTHSASHGLAAKEAHIVRQITEQIGGHAMLLRASAEDLQIIPAMHPQAPQYAKLCERIRHGFDPKHILNPGRLRY